MSKLKKTITATDGAALMLNIVIGAGLLALPGLAIKTSGTSAIYSWIVCAIAAVPLLVVFIIMGQRYPNAGGVAHFANNAFGSQAYTVTSFIFLGAILFGLPSIALTGGHYFAQVFHFSPSFIGLVLLFLAAGINLLSTTFTTKFSTIIASTMLVVLVAILLVGILSVNWNGVKANFAKPSELSISTVFAPFMMLFFAFTGWEVAAGISEEFKNPKRDFPKAMILSFIAACLLYFIMAFVVQALSISSSYESAFVSIASNKFGEKGEIAMSMIATFIIFANLTAAIWAVSRMVLSLSRERVLPLKLSVRENGSPSSAIFLTTLALSIIIGLQWAGMINLERMLALSGQNFLLLYGVAALSLYKLSDIALEKLAAIIAIIVIILVLLAGSQALYYPVSLVLLGILVNKINSRQALSR